MASQHKKGSIRKWIRIGFLTWAVVSTAWMVESFRTDDYPASLLTSDDLVLVVQGDDHLAMKPAKPVETGLIFICGAGPAAEAYVPLLRPLAEAGTPVFIVRLPYRMAPLAGHQATVLERVLDVMDQNQDISRWVVGGHSAGGKLASRFALQHSNDLHGLLLVATTHPRDFDLSDLGIPVIKIYGDQDNVAPVEKITRNAPLLPENTKFIAIKGGNHAQFGHYGPQFMDGTPGISREQQQQLTRAAIGSFLEPGSLSR